MARRSSVRHRRLVQELKSLRVETGLSQAQVADRMEWSVSKQEKLETGAIGVRIQDLRGMLDLYGLAGPEHHERREMLLQLARDAKKKGWWHAYGEAIPTWFEGYVGFEAEAIALHTYDNELVTGLLQTRDYAYAVMRAIRPSRSEHDIERRIAQRMERQNRLTGDNRLNLWVVLSEAVLRREVGSRQIMRAQLQHLAEISALPNVTVQILPLAAGAHASMGTSFAIIQLPEETGPDIVYLEDLTSAAYLEEPPHLERYTLVFDHLRTLALPDHATTQLMNRMARDLA